LKYFKTIGSEGGLLALSVDNQNIDIQIPLLDMSIDGEVLILHIVHSISLLTSTPDPTRMK
jgi:hypothetical protein